MKKLFLILTLSLASVFAFTQTNPVKLTNGAPVWVPNYLIVQGNLYFLENNEYTSLGDSLYNYVRKSDSTNLYYTPRQLDSVFLARDFVNSDFVRNEIHDSVRWTIVPNGIKYAEGRIEVDSLKFSNGQTLKWNEVKSTLDIPTGLGSTVQAGQEIQIKVYNNTAVPIPDGKAVYPNGSFTDVGTFPTVGLAQTNTHENVSIDYGLSTTVIPAYSYGMVCWFGETNDQITTGIPQGETWNIGDRIWISAENAGELTNIRPEFPDYSIQIGICFRVSATQGIIFITSKSSVNDTYDNFHNGTFRENFDFLITESGGVVTGSLTPSNGHPDMTMLFSDGKTMLVTTPAATITLIPGLDSIPQEQFVYITKAAKVLTVNTSGFPSEQHIKVSQVVLQSAITTGIKGALRNQNINDPIQNTSTFQGHLSHITERIRQLNSQWNSGTEAVSTIVTASTPDDVWITVTAGTVYQMHLQNFLAQATEFGDDIHVVNDFTKAYRDITNLNVVLSDALGASLNNTSFSVVLWGVINKTGEPSHLMLNLPTGSYAYVSPDNAINDPDNFAVYTIPRIFKGVGFLIARFTYTYKNNVWTLEDTEDLRGYMPNTSAGGGVGGVGVTTYLALDDTPSEFVPLAFQRVGSGGIALENVLASAINVGEFNDDGTYLKQSRTLLVDTINEFTLNDGVTIGSTLTVDQANNKIGVNTTINGVAANTSLHVAGTTSSDMIKSDMGYDINPVNDPSGLSGTAISGGVLDVGSYYYFMCYITDFGRTATQLVSQGLVRPATTAGNNTIRLTIPVSPDYRVIARQLWRTKVDAYYTATYQLVTINDNTTIIYDDNIPDANLTVSESIYATPNTTTNFITIGGVPAMKLGNGLTTIGIGSGLVNTGDLLAIGSDAGSISTTANYNTYVGNSSGKIATGGYNTAVGHQALSKSGGSGNSIFGVWANRDNIGGSYNTVMGYLGLLSGSGNGNVAIGKRAGYTNSTGSYSVFLGHESGYNETGSNKLYIANSSTRTPLIKGDFATNDLWLNATVYTNTINEYTASSGVTIDGVLIKDNEISTSHIANLSGTNTGDQDLSGYLTTEGDPIYTLSQAFNIDAGDITNLNNLSGTNTGDQTLAGLGGVAANTAITGATKTLITYDSKGLVTAGADATTANITEAVNKNYVTDAQQTVLTNTSGTNTGDQDLSGFGNVSKVGIPVNNQIGIWTGDGIIKGATNFTFDESAADFTIGTATNKINLSGQTINITTGGVNRLSLSPPVANLTNQIAYVFDTQTQLTATGTKLLMLKNNGAEKFYVDNNGDAYSNGILLNGDVSLWTESSGDIYRNSNVGIGVTDPDEKLEINGGGIKVVDNTYDAWLIRHERTDASQKNGIKTHSLAGLSLWTNDSEQVRIDVDGNVGIGTTSPLSKLDVNGDGRYTGALKIELANPSLVFKNTTSDITATGRLNFTTSDNTLKWQLGVAQTIGSGLEINEGSTNRFYMTSGGAAEFKSNLTSAGIIQASTYFRSSGASVVYASGAVSGTIYLRPNGHTSSTGASSLSTTLAYIGTNFQVNGTGLFSSTVTATNFILSSDRRLKKNIKPINTPKINEVKIIQFNYKSDSTNRKRYGVIAQELEKTNPEMVYEDAEGMKQVAYIDFLIAKIASLEKRLIKLENNEK